MNCKEVCVCNPEYFIFPHPETKQLRALNTTAKTDEKTNVSLSCKADLYVFEQVVWMKNDVDVSRHPRFTVSDSSSSDGMVYTLRIRRANVTDGGTYKCVGTRNDKKEVTVEISLTVQGNEDNNIYQVPIVFSPFVHEFLFFFFVLRFLF